MNYYDFDTSDYAMFSVGEFEEDMALFAKNYSSSLSQRMGAAPPKEKFKRNPRTPKNLEGKNYSSALQQRLGGSAPQAQEKGLRGFIKGHTRNIGGKLVLVRQGTRKTLRKGIAKGGAGLARLAGGKSNVVGRTIRQGTKIAAANPLVAAGVAGAGAVGGAGYGAYRFATRKKRRR